MERSYPYYIASNMNDSRNRLSAVLAGRYDLERQIDRIRHTDLSRFSFSSRHVARSHTHEGHMPQHRTPIASLLALTIIADQLGAQQTPRSFPDEPSAGAVIGAGMGLGVAGFLVGGLVGSGLAGDCTGDEWCQLEGAFYGAAVGGTFGLALGAHLGNRRRGNLAVDFLTGAAIWGAGIALATQSEGALTAAFIAIPIVQLVAVTSIERSTGRSRARARSATLSVLPTTHGGVMFAGSIPLP